MINTKLTDFHFELINNYIEKKNIKLLICDFNGVLDNYYEIKNQYMSDILNTNELEKIADLIVYIERQYMVHRAKCIEESINDYILLNGIKLNRNTARLIKKGMPLSKITESSKNFLNNLPIDYVIYTSLDSDKSKESIDIKGAKIYSNCDKPSSEEIKSIIRTHNVSSENTCVLGDGLIDDLMPARLLGAHTILVSPYAQNLISI